MARCLFEEPDAPRDGGNRLRACHPQVQNVADLFSGRDNFRDEDLENPVDFPSIAVEVFMNILDAARMFRFDLLCLIATLAPEMSIWARACDRRLFRLMCYISSAVRLNFANHVGDPLSVCRLLPFPG